MNWFQSQSVVLQAFIAGLFTWGCTIVGSAIVFFFKHISRKLLDIQILRPTAIQTLRPRSHGWLCHYDDPRCRFGIRIRKGEHQDKLSF